MKYNLKYYFKIYLTKFELCASNDRDPVTAYQIEELIFEEKNKNEIKKSNNRNQ